jgi:hypothetical protein
MSKIKMILIIPENLSNKDIDHKSLRFEKSPKVFPIPARIFSSQYSQGREYKQTQLEHKRKILCLD